MCKKMWAMAFGLALILSAGAWTQDTSSGKDDGHKVNWDSGGKGDTANSPNKTDAGLGKEYKLDPWGNEVKLTCPHGDFSQFNYKLSAVQEAKLKELKDEIDQKTKGCNWIVLDHYKKIRDCKVGQNSQDYYDAIREINRIEKIIRDANAELERGRLAILTLEQYNLEQEKKKALDDHRRNCIIHHKVENKGNGNCCDNKHHEEKCDYPYDYLWQQAENYGVFDASELTAKNPPKPEQCCDDMKGKSDSNKGDDWKIKKDSDNQ